MALRHYPKEIEELMKIWEPYEDKVKDMIYHQQLNLFTNHQNINQKDEKEAFCTIFGRIDFLWAGRLFIQC